MAWNTGGMTYGLPRMTRMVRILVIINVAAYLLELFNDQTMIGVFGLSAGTFWQAWRYITFQFLHAPEGISHILLNMLGLWFLGSPLEEAWGSRRFLAFYLSCGVFAGIAYVVISTLASLPPSMPIIGASGGVYGIVLACALLFPQMQIIFLFFPVPIRLAAIIIFGGMGLLVLQSMSQHRMAGAMSDVAHLGGAAMAAIWLRYWYLIETWRQRASGGGRNSWEKKMRRDQREQEELDRILAKISQRGMASLNFFEKRRLKKMSRRK
jgi:membrane associated rhomboid family serine protease